MKINIFNSRPNRELEVKFNNEPIIDNMDIILTADGLQNFSDSRLQLHNFIGCTYNASIKKELYNNDNNKNMNTAICQKIVEDINLNGFNVNYVKQLIERILQELSPSVLYGNNDPTNFQSMSVYPNMQLLNKKFPTKKYENSNQPHINDCKLTTTQKNSFNQYYNSNLMQVNPVCNIKTMTRYCESSLHKSHNDVQISRGPRLKKMYKNISEPQFSTSKQFRETMYGKEIHFNNEADKKNKQINYSQTLKYAYNNLGIVNDSSGIKNYKIPKIKCKDVVDSNTERGLPMETIRNFNSKKDIKTNKIKNIGPVKYIKPETIKNVYKENCTISNKIKDMKNNSKGNDTNSKKIKNININKMKGKNIKNDLNPGKSKKINIQPSNVQVANISIEQCKLLQPIKDSKEKEFENILREGIENINDDTPYDTRARTRSFNRKEEDILTKVDLKESKQIEVVTLNNEEPILEHSKMFSPTFYKLFQDEEKVKRLIMLMKSEFFENYIHDSKDDSKDENIFKYKHLGIDKQTKIKKVIKKENRQRQKMLGKMQKRRINGEESSNAKSKNEHKKYASDDNTSIVRTQMVFDNSNDNGNTSSGTEISNDYSSTHQDKSKINKIKKSKENYGNFKIIKDKNSKINKLKIVLRRTNVNNNGNFIDLPKKPSSSAVSEKEKPQRTLKNYGLAADTLSN